MGEKSHAVSEAGSVHVAVKRITDPTVFGLRLSLSTSTAHRLVRLRNRLASIVDESIARGLKAVCFDVSECEAIDAGAVLLLMNAGKTLQQLDLGVFVRGGDSSAFAAIRKHFQHYKAQKSERASIPVEPGDYPLRGVATREEMVSELQDWAACVGKVTKLPAGELARWRSHISEVATNTFQHAGADFGEVLLAGGVDPTMETVQLAVLDRGAGIPAVLRPSDPELAHLADGAVIRKACAKGVTSRCTKYNQGHGLYDLAQAVRHNGGRLQILSGQGLAQLSAGRMTSRELPAHPPPLRGTLTSIRVKGPPS